MNTSKKLGLVEVNSVETEVVFDGEQFPKRSWFRFFCLAQGDEAKEDELIQDNTSCILLHMNNTFSVGKGSKYMRV